MAQGNTGRVQERELDPERVDRAFRRRARERDDDEEDCFMAEEAVEDNTHNHEEAMEADPQGPPAEAPPRSEFDLVEQLILDMETAPDDEVLRGAARRIIKKLYLHNGSLPFNTADPIPVNLMQMTDEELIHVLENMMIHVTRSRHNETVNKVFNIFSNASHVGSRMMGRPIDRGLLEQFRSDNTMREATVEVFLGKSTQSNPLITFLVGALSHLSNLAVKFVDGQYYNQQPIHVPAPDGKQPVYTGEARQEGGRESSSSSSTGVPSHGGH